MHSEIKYLQCFCVFFMQLSLAISNEYKNQQLTETTRTFFLINENDNEK